MVQTEPAKEPVNLPSAEEILKAARSIDEITDPIFRAHGESVKFPSIQVLGLNGDFGDAPAHRISYTDPLTSQLSLYSAEPIDGRVIAAKFFSHLIEAGRNYRIARPWQLGIASFSPEELELMRRKATEITKPSYRIQNGLQALRQSIAHLEEYAAGRIQIVDVAGESRYYIYGADHGVHRVLIRTRIGSNHGSQAQLYRSFLEKLTG